MDVETKDVQDAITLSPYKPGTNLRVCPAPAALVKTHYSLLAISNVFGWAIIVISSDVDSCSGPAFILTRLDDLQTSIDQAEEFSPAAFNIQGTTQTVVVPTAPLCSDPSVFITHAAFAAWDRLVVLATSNGSLHIFSSYALIEQKNMEPLRSIPSASNVPLKMLVPNPSKGGPLSGVIALVHQDGTIKVVDCYDTEKIHWASQRATAAEWSPMGKRLLVGYDDGRLEFLTHDGISKGKIDPPALLAKEGLSVLHIKWLDQKNYIVTFAPSTDQSDELNETFCLNVPKQSESPVCTFTRVVDAITSDGDTSLSPALLTVAISVNPQADWKHIAISSFTNSTSLTLLGYDKSDKPFYLDLEEGRPEIPVTEEDYAPSAPLGFAFSYCTRQKSPLIWCYTTDGVLSLWKLALNNPSLPQDVEVWSEISDFSDISAVAQQGIHEAPSPPKPPNSADASTTSHVAPQATTASPATGFGTFASSSVRAFGQPSLANSQSSPGPASSLSKPPTSQVSAFGSSSNVAFGQPSLTSSQTSSGPFSSSTKLPASTPSKSSAFGSPSQVAFGQASLASSQTSSGSLTSPPKPPTSTSFGFGSFASSSIVAFGQPSLAKDASASSQADPKAPAASPAFGFGSFASSSSPAFGQPSLAKDAPTTSHADTKVAAAPQAFGFGSFASSGNATFGQPSLIKQNTSTSPQVDSKVAKPFQASGFGSFASPGNAAFGQPSLAKDAPTSDKAAAAPQTTGFGSFASSGNAAFAKDAPTSSDKATTAPLTSGFGSFASCGNAAFGQLSLAKDAPTSSDADSKVAAAPQTSAGFGSFASSGNATFGQPSLAKDTPASSNKPAAAPQTSGFGSFASSGNAAFGQLSLAKDAPTSSDADSKAATAPQTSRFGSDASSGNAAFGQLSGAKDVSTSSHLDSKAPNFLGIVTILPEFTYFHAIETRCFFLPKSRGPWSTLTSQQSNLIGAASIFPEVAYFYVITCLPEVTYFDAITYLPTVTCHNAISYDTSYQP
ncbi:uncharacterized protein PGTG_22378 [Puccinia graminis f. sp. tritici CRL 75-36-700-3]|uniref:Nucleoporin Nup159/Nup146 N-terminal domain-containing protein n=1 Tax=Puccinia graminis f. sp. tritici (strain CRL 75-36-700-3 / race SCCL) TaxID=418459 RepID=H6QUC6_PUCGT|nr:uncharacterized protein PGTG_22378 [Puccinia graminis f. sp. tritici CRL 75-36-700-3]EHS64589.1 hypothetical protein PGTG_22378 [Puccinia graminis f. sp. tritici CRL 75-36-700-3]